MPSMINLDDPVHKQRRDLVNKGFTPRRVADHEPRIRAICGELIDARRSSAARATSCTTSRRRCR